MSDVILNYLDNDSSKKIHTLWSTILLHGYKYKEISFVNMKILNDKGRYQTGNVYLYVFNKNQKRIEIYFGLEQKTNKIILLKVLLFKNTRKVKITYFKNINHLYESLFSILEEYKMI